MSKSNSLCFLTRSMKTSSVWIFFFATAKFSLLAASLRSKSWKLFFCKNLREYFTFCQTFPMLEKSPLNLFVGLDLFLWYKHCCYFQILIHSKDNRVYGDFPDKTMTPHLKVLLFSSRRPQESTPLLDRRDINGPEVSVSSTEEESFSPGWSPFRPVSFGKCWKGPFSITSKVEPSVLEERTELVE